MAFSLNCREFSKIPVLGPLLLVVVVPVAVLAMAALMLALYVASSIVGPALLEIQWYLFALAVMFGAAQVLRVNEHVRVDVLYGLYPTRMKVIVDLLGLCLFLLPVIGYIAWLSLPYLVSMVVTQEVSSNAGGLIRWPVMATIPVGLGVLLLQALAEIVKRIGWLLHLHPMDTHYDRPLQ